MFAISFHHHLNMRVCTRCAADSMSLNDIIPAKLELSMKYKLEVTLNILRCVPTIPSFKVENFTTEKGFGFGVCYNSNSQTGSSMMLTRSLLLTWITNCGLFLFVPENSTVRDYYRPVPRGGRSQYKTGEVPTSLSKF